MKKLFFLTLLLFVLACGKHNKTLDKLEHIKTVGDKNPKLALAMLDSLTHTVREEDEYTQMKYDLLSIRLHDKNYDVATSDKDIKRVVEYFEARGTDVEKQEAYFYAGSVYRDLMDSPRALEYFLKSTNTNRSEIVDTNLLCNAYSNISQIYLIISDYEHAISTSLKEMQLCQQLNDSSMAALNHITWCYNKMDSTEAAEQYSAQLLDLCQSTDNEDPIKLNALYDLLMVYCQNNDTTHALKAYNLIQEYNNKKNIPFNSYEKGLYFYTFGSKDSAMTHFELVLENEQDLAFKYSALRNMIRFYKTKHNYEMVTKYALLYLDVCDSINYGKQIKEAYITRNQYNYHHDKEAEQLLKEENQNYRVKVRTITITSVAAFAIMIAVYVILKNRQLRRLLKATQELQASKKMIGSLQTKLGSQREKLNTTQNELGEKVQELLSLNAELQKHKEELKQKDEELSERIEQNKHFLGLLHQAELEDKAEDIVQSMRQAAEGFKKISKKEEERFIKAVDGLFPEFKELLASQMGKFKEEQLFAFYLFKAGFTKTQVLKLTTKNKVTIWRWEKKYHTTLANK